MILSSYSWAGKTFLLFAFYSLFACSNPASVQQEIPSASKENGIEFLEVEVPQIAEYIRNIKQDRMGRLWFGTNNYGVICYNGDSLSYFCVDQGFNGFQITGITEDKSGNLWFSTDQGIVRTKDIHASMDEMAFVNFEDERINDSKSRSIFMDNQNRLWIGTTQGPIQFDGTSFKSFPLPYTSSQGESFFTNFTVWCTFQDSKGSLWFGTNGNGVYRFDGQSFEQFTMEDGLTDDQVDVIIEDRNGEFWMGTRFGGVSRFNGNTFTNYTGRDVLGGDEVVEIYEDQQGYIWMSSEGFGLYRYDGTNFKNFAKPEGLNVSAVQAVYQDRNQVLWTGGGGGLFRLEKDHFVNVTKDGPWE